eukprot:gene5244-5300_t
MGPPAVGKNTLGQALAARLGFEFLSTGSALRERGGTTSYAQDKSVADDILDSALAVLQQSGLQSGLILDHVKVPAGLLDLQQRLVKRRLRLTAVVYLQ